MKGDNGSEHVTVLGCLHGAVWAHATVASIEASCLVGDRYLGTARDRLEPCILRRGF